MEEINVVSVSFNAGLKFNKLLVSSILRITYTFPVALAAFGKVRVNAPIVLFVKMV